MLFAEDHDGETEEEEDGRDEERQVEADIAFSIDHAQLSSQGTDVDKQVEVVVDTGDGDGRVNNDTLAIPLHDLERIGVKLLNNQR